ncbi:MAG: glycosyltransferase family 2 protein [Fermentimonas sp.]|nr:glycosyltransferase family 2 protein [Fermentimonas sp.]
MKKENIAVLLTCHNRKDKTLSCLDSLYRAIIPPPYGIDVYLTDDGSADGTAEAVSKDFPEVNLIMGDGNRFWAGGMRLAWETAIKNKPYKAYLLINDDVVLNPDFFLKLIETDTHSYEKTGRHGIYSGATVDNGGGKVTYGGSRVKNYLMLVRLHPLVPTAHPQPCDITNANVLWVSREVVDELGIFDYRFTHGIADYDYTMQATKKNIPVLLAPGICGICVHDHGKNWRDGNYSLKERINYLKSPKGLAYSEYLYYIRKHFPMFLPYSFVMLWLKTFFPFIWKQFK